MADLVLREPCSECGLEQAGCLRQSCNGPGGRETVLDPDTEVFPNWRNDGFRGITVQDVIDTLTKEEKPA